MTTIDPRATSRGVMVVTPRGVPLTWRVMRVQWLDAQESQGRHHIYVNVLNEAGERLVGIPLLVRWPTGEARIVTEAKPGEQYSANFPMSPSRNEFSVTVDGLALSEVVAGIGMGTDTPTGFNTAIHTSTVVTFQRVASGDVEPPPPAGKTVRQLVDEAMALLAQARGLL